MSVVLPGSARLLEEAKYANRAGYSRHSPALALYTEDDAWTALEQLRSHPFEQSFEAADGIHVTFQPAGHILGSATLRVELRDGPTIRFSGDLGRPTHPLLVPPTPVGDCDHLVAESTYGDREHRDRANGPDALADVIERTVARGGKVIIPAFAVDRTEVLLYQLAIQRRLPRVPIYVDSPMALAALQIYREAFEERAADVRPELADMTRLLEVPNLTEVFDSDGSKGVSRSGGRPSSSPAPAWPRAGASCTTSRSSSPTSAAAWPWWVSRPRVHAAVSCSTEPPATVFVVHGEPDASRTLRDRIVRELDWNAVTPGHGERIVLHR